MSGLISDAELAVYKLAMDDMHTTFARDITVWRQSAETITIPSDDTNDDYDAFYNKKVGSQSTITYTSQSKTFKARIKYIDKQEKEFGLAIASAQNQINVTSSTNLVRIKVSKEASDYIENAQKITIDGVDFSLLTVVRPHGLIGLDYFTYYLSSLV